MIIFGTRGVKSTMKEGKFLCPQCAVSRSYKRKKVTKFFTLYFIPLIPLGEAGQFVECQTCKGTFVPRVLDYNPANNQNIFQSQYEKAMRHSMILMMLADGHIDESELILVRKIINKFGHNDISSVELNKLIEDVQRDKEPIRKYLSKIAPSLNEHGKEIILKCGLAVAAADGKIDDTEAQLIQEMAISMEMSSSHIKGILQDMAKPQSSISNN